MRKVLALLFNGAHICGHLHGQKAGGLISAAHYVQDGLVLYAEGEKHCICTRLKLREHGRAGECHYNHHGLVSHSLFGLDH